MEKDPGQVFNELKQDVSTYLGLKFDLLKLNTYERTAKIIAILSYGVILLSLIFFITLFLAIALAFFLGELTDNIYIGFVIVAGLYVLAGIIFMAGKNRIKSYVANIIIDAMMTKDEENGNQEPPNTAGEINL